MITIIDYGVGNLASIQNMLKRVGVDSTLARDPDDVLRGSRFILPGVGAFDSGMERLNSTGMTAALESRVRQAGCPLLGICLGMQLITEGSEEGDLPGLGWVAARTVTIPRSDDTQKIPHMGWNEVAIQRPHPLFEGLDANRFYLLHSYCVMSDDEDNVVGRTTYGQPFVSALHQGNVLGVQFHPEKSHRFGMTLLRNFAELPV